MGNEQSSGDGTNSQYRTNNPKFQRSGSREHNSKKTKNTGFAQKDELLKTQSSTDIKSEDLSDEPSSDTTATCITLLPLYQNVSVEESTSNRLLCKDKSPKSDILKPAPDLAKDRAKPQLPPQVSANEINTLFDPLCNQTSEKLKSYDGSTVNIIKENVKGFDLVHDTEKDFLQNNELGSKTDKVTDKLHAFIVPERDVKYVPIRKEQIKVNSTPSGNPFLSINEDKSDFELPVQNIKHPAVPLFSKETKVNNTSSGEERNVSYGTITFKPPNENYSKTNEGITLIKQITKEGTFKTTNLLSINKSGGQIRQSGSFVNFEQQGGRKSISRETVNVKGRLSRLGPRFQQQKQLRKHLGKAIGLTIQPVKVTPSSVLKDVVIAENLSGKIMLPKTNHNKGGTKDSNINEVIDVENKPQGLSYEECIHQMQCIHEQPNLCLPILQESLCSNLIKINSFISALKSFPSANEQILDQIKILKYNLLEFSVDKKISPFVIKPLSVGNDNSNPIIPATLFSSTNSPGDNVNMMRPKVNSSQAVYQDDLTSHQNVGNEMATPNTQGLGKNYQDILNFIYTSYKNNFVLDKFYICILCDFGTSENHVAMNHLATHLMQKQALIQSNMIENVEAHSCYTCSIILYGTDNHFQEHCASDIHKKILEIKGKKPYFETDVPKCDEDDEEKDDESVCSSKGDYSYLAPKSSPHEILLLISKKKQNNNNKGLVGLYCQVCNRYFKYIKSTPASSRSAGHSQQHMNSSMKYKNHKVFRCPTCNVELFGDQEVWQEHIKLQMHNELEFDLDSVAQRENEIALSSSVSNANELCKDPTMSLLHNELMKEVLKRYLRNMQDHTAILGSYCDLCKCYALDKHQWQVHINSETHTSRMIAPYFRQQKLKHTCWSCMINLICEDHVFNLHQQSVEHEAIIRHVKSKNRAAQVQNVEELSDNESEESADDDSDESTASSNTNGNPENSAKSTFIRIRVCGLPPDTTQTNLFDTFRKFGFVKVCRLHKSGNSGHIEYRDMESARSVLNKKIFMKGKEIFVSTKGAKRRRRTDKVEKMMPSVVEALQSEHKLHMLSKQLSAEVAEVGDNRTNVTESIIQDLKRAVPQGRVYIFGSQFIRLATRESDYDIYIDFNGVTYFTELSKQSQIEIIHDLLNKFSIPTSGFQVHSVIKEARVPILKVVHTKTQMPCDISCRSGLSMENSILTKFLLASDHRVKWLVLLTKWWMRTNDLLCATKFTSYTTTWLVMFFLMRKYVLSPVIDMRGNCPVYSIGNWDCRINKTHVHSNHLKCNQDSQLRLLVDFFKFYGSFKFNNVVLCPLTATLMPRKQFDELKLPPPFSPYIQYVQSRPDAEKLHTATPICLQDPFDLSHNIAKGVKFQDLRKFQSYCLQSAQICDKKGYQ